MNRPINEIDLPADFADDWREAHNGRVLLAAYAKLPGGTTAQMMYDTLVLVVIFDRASGRVVQAEASFVTGVARDFLAGLLVGYDLNRGPDELLALLQEVYFAPLKKALISAVKMIFSQYEEYKNREQA